MGLQSRAATALAAAALCAALSGCDRDGNDKSTFRENVERVIGEPQRGTGVLGGTAAPLTAPDAGPDGAVGSGADADIDAGAE